MSVDFSVISSRPIGTLPLLAVAAMVACGGQQDGNGGGPDGGAASSTTTATSTGTGGKGGAASAGGSTASGGGGSNANFVPSLFNVDHADYTVADDIAGAGPSASDVQWRYFSSETYPNQMTASIVDAPTWPSAGTFSTPPSNGKCLEIWGPELFLPMGQDQAISAVIAPASFPLTNLEGKTIMLQFKEYQPAGFNHNDKGAGGAGHKFIKLEIEDSFGINNNSSDLFIMFLYGSVDGAGGFFRYTWETLPTSVYSGLNAAPLLWPDGPAAPSPIPPDRWNVYHWEITFSKSDDTANSRFWQNQQLLFDLSQVTLGDGGLLSRKNIYDDTAKINSVKVHGPWNDQMVQTQAEYLDDFMMTDYSVAPWPFTDGLPDVR